MSRATDEAPPTAKTDVTGRGAPLVLVPGGLTGWSSWEPHAKRLSDDRTVIRTQLLCVDFGLQGHELPDGYSVRMESAALARALDALAIGEADVAAWSFGALTALDLALEHPGRVRSLTLIEPPAFWVLHGVGRWSREAAAFERATADLGEAEVSEADLDRFLRYASIVPKGVDPRELPQWPAWTRHRQSLRGASAPFRHEDDVGRLRGLDLPVLAFKGEGTAPYLRDIVDVLGQELPDARVEELPGAHALHLVAMERFLTILGAFLDERGMAREA